MLSPAKCVATYLHFSFEDGTGTISDEELFHMAVCARTWMLVCRAAGERKPAGS